MFAGVTFEKQLVKLLAHLGDDHLLRVLGGIDRDPGFFEPRAELFRAGRSAEVFFEGVQIDRETPVAAVGMAFEGVVDRVPFGEG